MLQNFGQSIVFLGVISSIFSIFATFFKMKDFYSKQHGSGLNDSFALPLIILGVGILSSDFLFFLECTLCVFFFIITSATSCHCISSLYYEEHMKQNDRS